MMSRAIGFWYMNPKLRTAWWPMSSGFMQRKIQSSPLPAFGPILAQKVAPQTSDPSKESAYVAERKGLQNLYTSVRFRPAPPNLPSQPGLRSFRRISPVSDVYPDSGIPYSPAEYQDFAVLP